MSESASFHFGLDPKERNLVQVQETIRTRYNVKKVEYYGDEWGWHIGVYFKGSKWADCGFLEEVQGSGWKIVQAGVRNGDAIIEIREVDEDER